MKAMFRRTLLPPSSGPHNREDLDLNLCCRENFMSHICFHPQKI